MSEDWQRPGGQGSSGQRQGVPTVPSQVTWAGLWSRLHGSSPTSQSCHSSPLHRMKGIRACVAFWALLAFPAAQSCGSSSVGEVRWTGTFAAPPQPSTLHTTSAAWRSHNAPHVGSQDCLIQTSTVPLQWLLPFTRRTPRCSPGSARLQLKPLRIRTLLMPEWGGAGGCQGPHH